MCYLSSRRRITKVPGRSESSDPRRLELTPTFSQMGCTMRPVSYLASPRFRWAARMLFGAPKAPLQRHSAIELGAFLRNKHHLKDKERLYIFIMRYRDSSRRSSRQGLRAFDRYAPTLVDAAQSLTAARLNALGGQCPRCNAPLRARLNHATGRPFFGCSRYPECVGTAPVAPDSAIGGTW